MKPTQLTELFANIRKTFVSFFSIFMFVALGVGVFLGISWAGPALRNAADAMFDQGRFHNIQIQFPYGLTDDDLKELRQVEGVTEIETGYQSFQTLMQDGMARTVKVQSLGQDINVPLVLEGELPEKPGEIALHAESAKKLNMNVGDSLTFEHDVSKDEANSLTLDSKSDSTQSQADTSDGMQYLAGDTFKVTAIINSADYVAKDSQTYGYSNSPSGSVDALVWVPDATFDAAAFQNGYPIVNVKCESLAGLETFSDEYDAKSDEITDRIAELGKGLAESRYEQLHSDAQTQVDEGQKKLDDAKTMIADGEQQIADGEVKLEQGRRDLDAAVANGEAELSSAYNMLIAGEAAKSEGEAKLASARSKVHKAQARLNEADNLIAEGKATVQEMRSYKAEQDRKLKKGEINQKQYNNNLDKHGAKMRERAKPFAKRVGASLPTVDHTNYSEVIDLLAIAVTNAEDMPVEVEGKTMTLGEARKKLSHYKKELSDGEAEFNAKTAELSEGWGKYYAGRDELETSKAQGEQELANGWAELENARAQVEDAKAQVAENEPKLEQAKRIVAGMKKADWSVMPRAYNAGVIEVSTFNSVTGNLSISMAALFIIVGLLVSYFAVSRIVHEQVTQIGTKKALGFRRGEITRSFLLYSGIAVLAGAIVGAIVGFLLVEGIIGGVLSDMFAFGAYPAFFGWPLFIIMTLLELALILGATYLACRSILKRHAVELLRGEKPPTGKVRFYEKWGIWDRLPLFVQTIVNNCVNDKRRMLSTIVGVAGSTALIVTAITLNNDVMKSYDFHYGDVYGFNAIAYVDNEIEGAAEKVESALQSEGSTSAQVLMKRYLMEEPNGDAAEMRVVVPLDESAFGQVYHLNPVTDGSVDLSQEGAWVAQAYSDHTGAKIGDFITVDAGDGMKHKVPILGFYEFWLTYHEMVMGADYYQKEFGDVSSNAVFANTNGVSVDDMVQTLSGIEGFDSIKDDARYQYGNFDRFSSVCGAVVAIYLALAALMAIVVLLNLNVMFIDEKKRELIVLMINGFSVKDAKRYISYDSIVLTALGIIAGIILGCIMGSFTVAAIEPSTGVFVKSVDGWAVVIGIAGSAVLAIIMSKIALRRIPRFELTDINKA